MESSSGTALGLWTAALGQLQGSALGSSFREQLSGHNFGKPLWELALDSNCGEHMVVCKNLQVSDWYYRLCNIIHIYVLDYDSL